MDWKNVLMELEKRVPQTSYLTWFSNLKLIRIEDGVAFLGVPNVFHVKPLGKFNEVILESFANCGMEVKELHYEVFSEAKDKIKPRAREVVKNSEVREKVRTVRSVVKNPEKGFSNGLNKKFTLEGFVIGSNNDLAVSVAEGVVEKPGVKFNPFFLYGGPGLGKTHLVQAIGNALLAKNPEMKILYTPINHFYSEFINSIKTGGTEGIEKFREKFRGLDVLIIDDFQFIVGKEKSQEEFFNIFNDLYQLNKQIIVTSDRLPHQIKSVDERLASRLTWAGAIDLQFPNFEDKCAILKAKAEFMGVEIEEEAIEYLAENVKTNIRDLEGEFSRVLAMADLKQLTPLELITGGYIGAVGNKQMKAVTPKQVVATVAKFYEISVAELCGKSRVSHIKNARQVAMYILAEELGMSMSKISGEVGLKDHTTVMHGVKRIKNALKLDFALREQIATIREKIYG